MRSSANNTMLMLIFFCLIALSACTTTANRSQTTRVYLAADSTVADHKLNGDYITHRHPITGWGQKFQAFMLADNLAKVKRLIDADRVEVINKARGGRSTRTFFEEGRWNEIYQSLQPYDLVLIQFGHNDASVEKHERYVNVVGYQQYLRLFVAQARAKKALPILITPVNRNYPWKNGRLENSHGDYPQAMKEVALEIDVLLIDLGQISRDFFSAKGEEFVSKTYFMNLPAGAFPAYPQRLSDNTYFQPAGAEEVARMVFEAMQNLQIQP